MADPLKQVGFVPVPDPTKLTTDAVEAAKADIEKLFNTKLNGEVAVITEKFAGRDLALAAALKAAQELVKQQNDSNTLANDKMSEGFTKQIESLDEKIDDLKDRVSEIGRKDYAVVGAYIVGAIGIVALISAVIITAFMHRGA
jgi:uncharacterized protein involved in exopolysaccharide biosynthesis